MVDFSTILQTPEVRAIVQERALERAFHDALFPLLLFRSEANPVEWPQGVGDSYIATAPGLLANSMGTLRPGVDPTPQSYAIEQWEASLNQYAGTIDTHMPTSAQAIVDLFMRNAQQLGMQAARSVNALVRNRMFNAAEAGNGVVDGVVTASTSVRVKRLNGFTRARNPLITGASKVRFDTVSGANPLRVSVAGTANTVIGYTPDVAGDEFGPGVLTMSANVTCADRAYIKSYDCSKVIRVGGGNSVNDIDPTDLPRLESLRAVVADLKKNNVPRHLDGLYHMHLEPESVSAFYADQELQRLHTGVPDAYCYKEMALGVFFGVIFVENNEVPLPTNVGSHDGVTFDQDDNFAGEFYSTGVATGTPIHRALVTGHGGIFEFYQDPANFLTEAGMIGHAGPVQVSNNGIELMADRITMVLRSPLNRLQDVVAASWKFLGDWPVRTDAATGDDSRYKRFRIVQHAVQGT